MSKDLVPEIPHWLQSEVDQERRERIWNLGLATGWRRLSQSEYGPANFERALVLHRLGELLRPSSVLEIGAGRGLGSFSLADASVRYGYQSSIETIDMIPDEQPQPWARRIGGIDEEPMLSRKVAWAQIDRELQKLIQVHTGPSTQILPRLHREKKRYDLIFIDAGHDLFSVMHDLTRSVQLLSDGGVILMDDFAPLEDFGIGTCVSTTHARNVFEHVIAFPTEGLVYGGAAHPTMPRGMVLLQGPRSDIKVRPSRLLFWRFLSWMLQRSYTSRRLSPLAVI